MKKPMTKTATKITANILTLALLFASAASWAPATSQAAPNRVNYQGILVDVDGSPVPDGDYAMSFRIFDAATSGTLLWMEEQSVPVMSGLYSVALGSGTPLLGTFDAALFSSDSRWLEIMVSGEALTPRQQVTSVAFSLQAQEAEYAATAGDADTLGGMSPAELLPVGDTLTCPGDEMMTGIDGGTGDVICDTATADTHAGTICGPGAFLNGDGTCDAGFLDADGVDAYNAAFDTETEIDAAVSNNGYSTGAHSVDTNTHAGTICGAGAFLNGDGSCDYGFLDANGVDAYNSAFDTEAEIDAAVADNGYSTGAHSVNTNAGTICGNGYFLNGDGTCDYADSSWYCSSGRVCTGGHAHSTYTSASNLTQGTLSTGRYDAYQDLTDALRLNNNSTTDLLTRSQLDSRYAPGDNTTKTGYLFIDAATMTPNTNETNYGRSHGGIYLMSPSTTWNATGNVDVPDGATFTGLYVYYYQTIDFMEATYSCTLYRRAYGNPSMETIASIGHTGMNASADVESTFTSSMNGRQLVSESNYTYYMYAYANMVNSTTFIHKGCRVRFTYTELKP